MITKHNLEMCLMSVTKPMTYSQLNVKVDTKMHPENILMQENGI
jgi:hypothetical protein